MKKIITTKEELAEHKDKVIPFKSRFGFVPRKLDIKDRPELSIFPYNIMFMNFRFYYGQKQSGIALYEPVLDSYEDILDRKRLLYRNIYDPENKIIIEYFVKDMRYEGFKYIKGRCVREAHGKEWKMFFVHLTMTGPEHGEGCKFEDED
jgi:hypothetical protein